MMHTMGKVAHYMGGGGGVDTALQAMFLFIFLRILVGRDGMVRIWDNLKAKYQIWSDRQWSQIRAISFHKQIRVSTTL